MQALLQIVASNALLVVVLATGVSLLGRVWRNPLCLHLLWIFVLLKLVTPPLLTLPVPLPAIQTPLAMEEVGADRSSPVPARVQVSNCSPEKPLPARNVPQLQSGGFASEHELRGEKPSSIADVDAPVASVEGRATPWLTLLAWAWGVGIVLSASSRLCRIVRFLRLLRCSEPPSGEVMSMAGEIAKRLGLRRVPDIRMMPVRMSPLVWSIGGRPRVFLPTALFDRLDRAAREAILAHELAHVRRKDHWIRLLEMLITTLFWWHPVVWWAARQLQELEDQCCDAMVLNATPQAAKTYAAALLDTLDFLSERSISAPLGAMAAKSSTSLARRITMLKNSTPTMRLTVGRIVFLAAVVAGPMALAFGAKPPIAASQVPPSMKKDSPGPALPARSEITSEKPRVEIDLAIVSVPRNLDLVRQLPNGGVILGEAETKKFLEQYQADGHVGLQFVRPLGADAELKWDISAASKSVFAFQAVPETIKEDGTIVLRIKPVVLAGGLHSRERAAAPRRPEDWPMSVNAELKPNEAVLLGGWGDGESKQPGKEFVTVLVVQARRHSEPAKSNERPAVERRTINKLVKDFPEKTDLSTPESAVAAFHRVAMRSDPTQWLELSAWKYGPRDVAELKLITKAHESEMGLMNDAYRRAEIIEVLAYKDGLAQVISKLDFPDSSGRDPYSVRTVVRIGGLWKNFGEGRLPSVAAARDRFDRIKDHLWGDYVTLLDGIKKGHPATLGEQRPKRTAPIAPGEPLGISVEKADLIGRIEWAFAHGASRHQHPKVARMGRRPEK